MCKRAWERLRQFVRDNSREFAFVLLGTLFGMAIGVAFAFGFSWGRDGFLSSTAATWAQAFFTTATIGTALYVGHLQVSEGRQLAETERDVARSMAEDDRRHIKQLGGDERRSTLNGFIDLATKVVKVMENSASRLPSGSQDLDGAAARATRFLNPVRAGVTALEVVPLHQIPYAYVAAQGMNIKLAAVMYVDWLTEISKLPNEGAEWTPSVETAVKTLAQVAEAAGRWSREMENLAEKYDGHVPPVLQTMEGEP